MPILHRLTSNGPAYNPLYMLDQKTFSFHDADGVLVTLEARLKDGQFSISGRCGGSSGQCQDEIKPRTDKQRELLKLWKDYHLNSKTLPHNFKEHLEGLMCVIEYEEKEYKPDETKDALAVMMEEYGIDEDRREECAAYLEGMGSGTDLSDFEEVFSGKFDSDEDFARNMAEERGAIDSNAQWPNNCIDWEKAARELMQDYFESNGYYFRSM